MHHSRVFYFPFSAGRGYRQSGQSNPKSKPMATPVARNNFQRFLFPLLPKEPYIYDGETSLQTATLLLALSPPHVGTTDSNDKTAIRIKSPPGNTDSSLGKDAKHNRVFRGNRRFTTESYRRRGYWTVPAEDPNSICLLSRSNLSKLNVVSDGDTPPVFPINPAHPPHFTKPRQPMHRFWLMASQTKPMDEGQKKEGFFPSPIEACLASHSTNLSQHVAKDIL